MYDKNNSYDKFQIRNKRAFLDNFKAYLRMSNTVKQAEVSGYTGYKSIYSVKRLRPQSADPQFSAQPKLLLRLAVDVITWILRPNSEEL